MDKHSDDINSEEDKLGQAIFALFTSRSQEEFLRFVRDHPELMTEEADKRLADDIARVEKMEGANTNQIVDKMEYCRHVLAKCRRRGIEYAFLPHTNLDRLYEWGSGRTPQLNRLPANVRQMLESTTTLHELLVVSAQAPIIRDLLAELGIVQLRNMVIVAGLMQLGQASDPDSIKKVITENPELLDDDTMAFLDTSIAGGSEEEIGLFSQLRERLVECRRIGLDNFIREFKTSNDIDTVKETARTWGISASTDPQTVYSQFKELKQQNPELLSQIENSSEIMAALFALADALTFNSTAMQVLSVISQHPVILTRAFDQAFSNIQGFVALTPPTDDPGLAPYHEWLKNAGHQLLNLIRTLRGLGLDSQLIGSMSQIASQPEFQSDPRRLFDITNPTDRFLATSFHLIASPLPLYACQIIDGHLTLEEASKVIASRGLDEDLGEAQIQFQSIHINTLLELRSAEKQIAFVLAELNYILADLTHESELLADASDTARNCAAALYLDIHDPGERLKIAERWFRSAQTAVNCWKQIGRNDSYANALVGLSAVYMANIHGVAEQNYRESVQLLTTALEVGSESLTSDQRAKILLNLGTAYIHIPENRVGEHLRKATVCFEKALGEIDPEIQTEVYLEALNGLGAAFGQAVPRQHEHVLRSIGYYQEILNLTSATRFPESRAKALLNIGVTLHDLSVGDQQENVWQAINYLENAVNLCTQLGDPQMREVQGIAWANLATLSLELMLGDRLFNLRRGINWAKSALGALGLSDSSSWNGAILFGTIGALYSAMADQSHMLHDVVTAIPYLEAALETFRAQGAIREQIRALTNVALALKAKLRLSSTMGKEDLVRSVLLLQEALELTDLVQFVEERIKVGRSLGETYLQYAEYLDSPWEKAEVGYGKALEAAEVLYQGESTFEARQNILKQMAEIAKKRAWCLAKVGRFTETVEMLETSRGRTITAALMLDATLPSIIREEDKIKFEGIRSQLKWIEAEERGRAYLPLTHTGIENQVDLSMRLRAARHALTEIVSEIRTYAPEFMRLRGDMPSIASHLRVDQPLVYICAIPQGGFAIILPHGQGNISAEHVIWLPELTTQATDRLLGLSNRDVEKQIPNGYLGGQLEPDLMRKFLPGVLSDLGEHLAPLLNQLKALGYVRCIVVPLGLLSLFPLHAVRLQDGTFLDEHLEVSYAPSGGIYCHLHPSRANSEKRNLLAVGASSSATPTGDFALAEIDGIASLFVDSDVHILSDNEASRANIISALPTTRYFHFAWHGHFTPTAPLRSFLLLANEDVLEIGDVLSLNLDLTRLVVLSACQTGITDFIYSPDETVGFPSGFLQAGSAAVVSSLWSVNDMSTVLLMLCFYKNHLQQEQSPVEALRNAQMWLRKATNAELAELFTQFKTNAVDASTRIVYATAQEMLLRHTLAADPKTRPFEHPYYWAAFTCYGA